MACSWLLLLALAWAVDDDVPPVPREPPPPLPPASSDSPYSVKAPIPGVVGKDGTFDLERLGRVMTSYSIDLDATAIDRITEEQAKAIERHLAADPRWRLVEWEGALVAFLRHEAGKERTVRWDGFRERPKDVQRVAIRFEPWPATSGWGTSPYVSHVDAGNTHMTMKDFVLSDPPWAGWHATALAIEGPHLAFDVYEARPSEDRDGTIDALMYQIPVIEALATYSSEVATRGYVRAILPRGEPDRTGPVAEINAVGPGMLEVRARVNPGEAGWTWARILDEALVPWEALPVAAGTRERIGWSSVPTERFYLEGVFPVARGSKMAGTLEIWFQPDAGGEPRRLDALPITIPRH